MMQSEIIGLIGTVGFPIAVTVYLLLERGKTTKELTKAITELTILIKAKVK